MEGVDSDFLRRVRYEYDQYELLSTAESSSARVLKQHVRGGLLGCLFIPILHLLNPLSKRALDLEKDKHRFPDFEAKAYELISETQVRTEICTALHNLPKTEIVTDTAFVQVVVGVLNGPRLVEKFEIPNEPALFAIVAHHIKAHGLRSYCGGEGPTES